MTQAGLSRGGRRAMAMCYWRDGREFCMVVMVVEFSERGIFFVIFYFYSQSAPPCHYFQF